ncbi:hypothetical protein PV371_37875 [Streptomyces sp. TX20-6-3]|nr:hypothetical protein [Streptomyces sp. TX20-6-3]
MTATLPPDHLDQRHRGTPVPGGFSWSSQHLVIVAYRAVASLVSDRTANA